MKVFNVFAVIAFVLALIGAFNWLVVGIFGFNFVTFLTGSMLWLERVIYILVGIAAIYLIVWACVAIPRIRNDYEYGAE